MEKKPRKCKGTGKAKGVSGCAKETLYLTYGLCNNCLHDFLFETDAGKLLFQKRVLPKARIAVTKVEKQQYKDAKEKLKTKSDYEKYLQKEINTIVRLLDKGFVCISSRKPLNEKYDAGHFYSVGSNPQLRFNLLNIYAQSVYSNQYKSGDAINFLAGLRHFYGNEHAEYVLNLKSLYKELKLSVPEIKEATTKARHIVKTLKADNLCYDAEQRIEMRKAINKELGIYN